MKPISHNSCPILRDKLLAFWCTFFIFCTLLRNTYMSIHCKKKNTSEIVKTFEPVLRGFFSKLRCFHYLFSFILWFCIIQRVKEQSYSHSKTCGRSVMLGAKNDPGAPKTTNCLVGLVWSRFRGGTCKSWSLCIQAVALAARRHVHPLGFSFTSLLEPAVPCTVIHYLLKSLLRHLFLSSLLVNLCFDLCLRGPGCVHKHVKASH